MADANNSGAVDGRQGGAAQPVVEGALHGVLDERLLELLRCPEKREPLALAPLTLVEKLNVAIRGGKLSDRGGDPVREPVQAALVRKDGQIAYLVRDRIPELRIGRGVDLAQLGAGAAGRSS